jgi:hypothetical protein
LILNASIDCFKASGGAQQMKRRQETLRKENDDDVWRHRSPGRNPGAESEKISIGFSDARESIKIANDNLRLQV